MDLGSCKHIDEIKETLLQNRLKETHRIYRVGMLLALPGSMLAIYLNSFSPQEKILQALVVLVVLALLFGLLEWGMRKNSRPSLCDDIFLFINTCVFLLILHLFRRNGILPALVWNSSLLFIIFASRSKARILFFLGLNGLATLIFAISKPNHAVTFDLGTYVGIITSLSILTFVMLRMVRIYQSHEEDLFQDFLSIQALRKKDQLLHEKLDTILSVTEDMIIDYDGKTQRITVSERTRHLAKKYGIPLETPERLFQGRVPEEENIRFCRSWEEVARGRLRDVTCEISFLNPVNGMRYARLHLLRYESQTDEAEHIVVALKDITQKKEQDLRLAELAYSDPFTGLPNREGFRRALEQHLIQSGTPCYMVCLDIVGFHHVNSVYGYQFGDEILKKIAKDLASFDLDGFLLGRLDSDVFGFALHKRQSLDTLVSFFEELEIPFEQEAISFIVRFRSGIAEYPHASKTAEDLIRHSDIALSKAKTTTRTPVHVYDPKMSEEISRRHRMLNALEKAITLHEIYIVYQPKYSANGRDILGYEALARWNSQEFGQVAPLEFIQLAEQSKLIVDVERYIIRAVCSFIQQIPKEKRNVEVSINISSQHLLTPSFVEEFCDLVESYGIFPFEIGIELTETALIQSFDMAVSHLEQLRERGFRIYLDDFGTGYSSLSYLNLLPIDVLKIDRSFVMNMGKEGDFAKNHRLVDLMINFSKALSLSSVAEGVEDAAQFALLKDMGCEEMQGYYFSKPISQAEVLVQLAETKP